MQCCSENSVPHRNRLLKSSNDAMTTLNLSELYSLVPFAPTTFPHCTLRLPQIMRSPLQHTAFRLLYSIAKIISGIWNRGDNTQTIRQTQSNFMNHLTMIRHACSVRDFYLNDALNRNTRMRNLQTKICFYLDRPNLHRLF